MENSGSNGEYYCRLFWAYGLIRQYLTTGRKHALIKNYALNKHVRLLTRLYDMCAMEAKRFAAVTLASLKEQRSDSHFDKIWEELLAKADEFDCEEPVLPRRRRAPKRIDEASSTTHFDATPEDMYHRYYFEVLDTLMVKLSADSRMLPLGRAFLPEMSE